MNTQQAIKQIEQDPEEMRSAMHRVIDSISDDGLLMAITDKDEYRKISETALTAIIYKRAIELGDEQ
jgi:hypothetical protein